MDSWRFLLRIVVLCLFCDFGQSRTLSSHQLATGEWKVTLRGFFDPSSVFISENTNNILWRRRPFQSLECTCSLCDDGTFSLTPIINSKEMDDCMSLRGRWKVLSNPYCITDRFYDQLTLVSYPQTTTHMDDCIEFTLRCRMWGRYSRQRISKERGRMTHGSLTRTRKEQSTSRRPWWRRQASIVASFTAIRDSSEPIQEGWEDQKYFGY